MKFTKITRFLQLLIGSCALFSPKNCIFVPNILITTMASNKDLNRLKVVLAEKKKSNLWLSKELGCAPTTVSKWCTNSSQPPLEMLMKTAKLLDVEIMDLINKKTFESI